MGAAAGDGCRPCRRTRIASSSSPSSPPRAQTRCRRAPCMRRLRSTTRGALAGAAPSCAARRVTAPASASRKADVDDGRSNAARVRRRSPACGVARSLAACGDGAAERRGEATLATRGSRHRRSGGAAGGAGAAAAAGGGPHAELEAERAAAEGAASEAMSMILRLQRDKSEAMMEARQYRRYAEERFAHDAAECDALRDAVERRDDAVRSLAARLRACQARLLHLGYPSPSPTAASSSLPSSPTSAAAGARRGFHHHHNLFSDDDVEDCDDRGSVRCLDRPADVGTPRTHHLLNRMPDPCAADKGVVLFGSPSPRHARAPSLSSDSCRVALADEFPLFAPDDRRDAPDLDDDAEEQGDRVYTVDAVHGVPMMAPEDCCYIGAPMGDEEVGFRAAGGSWAEEEEIQKLKARLQALEADRESMRHAIMSMGDEKAQVVLLREIAQQLCRDAAPFPAVPLKVQPRLQPVVVTQRKVVKKRTSFIKIFIVTVFKWVASVFCWRRKSNRIRYPIGMCGSNVGLMLVLDRFPKQRQKKIPKRKLSPLFSDNLVTGLGKDGAVPLHFSGTNELL